MLKIAPLSWNHADDPQPLSERCFLHDWFRFSAMVKTRHATFSDPQGILLSIGDWIWCIFLRNCEKSFSLHPVLFRGNTSVIQKLFKGEKRGMQKRSLSLTL